MRWLLLPLLWCLSAGTLTAATEGHIYKVLPQLLDKHGRNSTTPSLYDRDAYQAYLRLHPKEISALRFAVQWKAKSPESKPLQLKVELRGAAKNLAKVDSPVGLMLVQEVRQHHWFSHWASLNLSADQYKSFGEVTAWRATLWDGDQLLDEQRSFLW